MSLDQGTRLRNGKIIDPSSKENTPENLAMSEPNSDDSDTNESSDISSQLSEMKENYERKISELQTEFSQLKDLMMAIMNESNNEEPSTSAQGLSKQPQVGRDSTKSNDVKYSGDKRINELIKRNKKKKKKKRKKKKNSLPEPLVTPKQRQTLKREQKQRMINSEENRNQFC